MKIKWLLIPVAAMALLAACNHGGNSNNPSGVTSSQQTNYDPATSVTINEDSFPKEVFVTDTFKASATVLPETANPNVTWSSTNSKVATVDQEGNVSALAIGTTTIRATTENGLKANKAIIVRQYVPVETFSVGKSEVTLAANGGFHYMDAAVGPVDATNKKVNYVSSNESVATVDEKGMVTAKAAGNAIITATSDADSSKTATTNVTVTAQSWDNKQVVDVNADNKVDFQDVQRSAGLDAIPVGKSTNIELLVVPYEFPDYPFKQKTLDDIDALFNGNGAEDTRYWESVSSYYKKASYGKVNIHVTIGEKYVASENAADVKSGSRYSVAAAKTVLSDYKNRHNTNGKEFDSDGNGIVDALYMVYSAMDYSRVPSLDNELFWAYCHWTGESPNANSPSVNTYMWASYDFMYESGESKVDAHTFIHESGHLMGANDYYNYNKASSRSPLGGIDMMDYNIGSHNVWTKMAYGWLNPIYVDGNAKVTIKSAQAQGDAIVIRDGWNGSAFDEMMILELSTPTGLNELDATTPYKSRPLVYDIPGIKLYHVDNRLGRRVGSTVQYLNGTPTRSNVAGYYQVSANSDNAERNDTPEFFYEIGLIQREGKATLIDPNINAQARNDDLFKTGDYFRFEDYSAFFQKEVTVNGQKVKRFNDGSEFKYQIYFESVTAEEATIVIQKVA